MSLNLSGTFTKVSKISFSLIFKNSATAKPSTAEESPPLAEFTKQCKN